MPSKSDSWLRSADTPPSYMRTLCILHDLRIPYRVSENEIATTCEQAATVRVQESGEVGIPVWQELKTLLLWDCLSDRVVAIHGNGNRKVRMDGYRMAGRSEYEPFTFGASFGAINPFLLDPEIEQYVDIRLLELPTVATNAGAHDKAVWFNPDAAFTRLGTSGYRVEFTYIME